MKNLDSSIYRHQIQSTVKNMQSLIAQSILYPLRDSELFKRIEKDFFKMERKSYDACSKVDDAVSIQSETQATEETFTSISALIALRKDAKGLLDKEKEEDRVASLQGDDSKEIPISIMLISNDEDDISDIERHLGEYMRLPWRFIPCTSLKESTLKMQSADLIILDLALKGIETPEEIFTHMDHDTFGIPIIVLTGEGQHDLATYVIERGAADQIIRGKFSRLIDAIEFALIKQKISARLEKKNEDALSDAEFRADSNSKSAHEERVKEKGMSDQMVSWLTGGYSATSIAQKDTTKGKASAANLKEVI